MYFFETVVRIHRKAEGTPYTGLKPAGLDLGPVIPVADEVLESSSPDKLVKLLIDATQNGTREEFNKVMEKKNFSADNVSAGREYIEAYVPVHSLHRKCIQGCYSFCRGPRYRDRARRKWRETCH